MDFSSAYQASALNADISAQNKFLQEHFFLSSQCSMNTYLKLLKFSRWEKTVISHVAERMVQPIYSWPSCCSEAVMQVAMNTSEFSQ